MILSIKDLRKIYHTKQSEILAVDNFSFDLKEGEFVAIVGPSGCGKSTILSILCGLDEASGGTISFKEGLRFGYMLQGDNLFEWQTIFKNCLLGLEINKEVTKESKEYVEKLLKTYGLWEFKDAYPSNLSGGMRQRVSLIRTLATKPDLLFLDEPFSALDYQTRIMVTEDIYSILRKEKITAIIVTHDISEAISLADRVLVLSKRPGTIKDIHKIDFEMEKRTPINCRQSPKFSQYFDTLWKELGVNGN